MNRGKKIFSVKKIRINSEYVVAALTRVIVYCTVYIVCTLCLAAVMPQSVAVYESKVRTLHV